LDLLSKAQNFSLEDQRGRIDGRNLEIPDFLLTNNLFKTPPPTTTATSQPLPSATVASSLNASTLLGCSFGTYSHHQQQAGHDSLLLPTNSDKQLNQSSISLPACNNNNKLNTNNISNNTCNQYQQPNNYSNLVHHSDYMTHNLSNTISRSRSPIVIVYDNEDDENIEAVVMSSSKTSQSALLSMSQMNTDFFHMNNGGNSGGIHFRPTSASGGFSPMSTATNTNASFSSSNQIMNNTINGNNKSQISYV
jgi:hypothetical protein